MIALCCGVVHLGENPLAILLVGLVGRLIGLFRNQVDSGVEPGDEGLEQVHVLADDGQHQQLAVRWEGVYVLGGDGIGGIGHRARREGEIGQLDVPCRQGQSAHQKEGPYQVEGPGRAAFALVFHWLKS